MQKTRKIFRAVSEETALPTNQPTNQPTILPIITSNTDLTGPRWRRYSNDIQKYCLKFERYVAKSSEIFIVYFMKDEKSVYLAFIFLKPHLHLFTC